MSTLKVRLDRIDLSAGSRNTLAALIKLLGPHIPYSLHILGTILSTAPRASTLQDVDPSKITLWSTVPLQVTCDAIATTDASTLFSVVIFSHVDHQFRFFCSGESTTWSSPMEAEKTHVKQVFDHLRDIAWKTRPTYNSTLTALGRASQPRHYADTDPPMIVIWAVHAKWADVLAPMSTLQHPGVRYVFPRGTLECASLPSTVSHWTPCTARLRGEDDSGMELEVSEVRASDLPFVYGASTVPRTAAYILSRAPYSVCLRSRQKGVPESAAVDEGRPVACALMHSDGSIGALRVDSKYQRQGLGRLVLRALAGKLDLSKGQEGELDMTSDEHRDSGGGALGWNWTDTEVRNEAANRFFASFGSEESWRTCHHWTYMPLVDPNS